MHMNAMTSHQVERPILRPVSIVRCARTLLVLLGAVVIGAAGWAADTSPAQARFVRFQRGATTAYGVMQGEQVRELSGDLFGAWVRTDRLYSLDTVKLLPPTQPTQVLAMAGNYRSHLNSEEIPPKFRIPQPFLKSPSCLIGHGAAIVLPKDARDVHFEGELVLVIGKTTRQASREKAAEAIFGVTCGNDVSERYWQNDEQDKDIQWWRAKGSDTFGPVGPWIVTGLDWNNLELRVRVNGEVKQQDSTSRLIHDAAAIVSMISRYVTLQPGDLIFTGTPGTTSALKPGDVVEVEIEGIGVLRNSVE